MKLNELISAFKVAVRQVIKEELTEILQEGLQSTINEMSHNVPVAEKKPVAVKNKVKFSENKWSSILNETPASVADVNLNNYAELMNENYETMQFTSKDAVGFGMSRATKTEVMHDPETGKNLQVNDTIAAAMNRNYSDLMKAIDRKKGNAR